MAIQDNRKMYSIADFDPNFGMWSVNVQVVEIHRSQVTKGSAVQKTFRRYLLADENGTTVSGVAYEPDMQFIANILQQFKRYRISNAKLTPAYGYFKVSDYGFSWVLKPETPIEPIAEPTPPPIPFSYTFCPFKDFASHADKEEGFNIKGIIVHAFPPKIINLSSSHREFVLVDQSMTPIILTMWNSYGSEEGSLIANNIDNHPIIIGVNIKATTFHGLSLCTRMYSCILINPPTADTSSLSQWYTANKDEITKLVKARAYKKTDMLLPPPALSQAIDVPTALTSLPIINSAWVSGRLRFTPTPQQYYICACANCFRKADVGSDWILLCSNCGAYEEVKLRCRVPVQLEGEGKYMQVVLTSPDVEQLTGITAEQMKDAHQYGDANPADFNVNDDLLLSLDKLHVICFVKKYDSKTMGTTRTPGLRFSVVKTYAIDALNKDQNAETSASETISNLPTHTPSNQPATTGKNKESEMETQPEKQETMRAQASSTGQYASIKLEKGQATDSATYKVGTESGEGRASKRGKNK